MRTTTAPAARCSSSTDAPDGRRIHTCLSHDIVAHELGHAVLDGPAVLQRSDVRANRRFHEYFGDAVAMMSSLATRETAQVTRGGPAQLIRTTSCRRSPAIRRCDTADPESVPARRPEQAHDETAAGTLRNTLV
jgi:hypothetical protein